METTMIDRQADLPDDDESAPAFFDALDDTTRAALLERGERRRFAHGEHLMHAGDPGHQVMVILAGSVAAVSPPGDRGPVVLAVRGRGELIGEMAALESKPRSASVTALSDGEALVIPGALFDEFLDATPSAARAALATVARRLREADTKRISADEPEPWHGAPPAS